MKIKDKVSCSTLCGCVIPNYPNHMYATHCQATCLQHTHSHSYMFSFVPKTELNQDKRAFSVVAPKIWYELPITLKSCETVDTLCENLKSYFFEIAFSPKKNLRSLALMMSFVRPCSGRRCSGSLCLSASSGS